MLSELSDKWHATYLDEKMLVLEARVDTRHASAVRHLVGARSFETYLAGLCGAFLVIVMLGRLHLVG